MIFMLYLDGFEVIYSHHGYLIIYLLMIIIIIIILDLLQIGTIRVFSNGISCQLVGNSCIGNHLCM